MPSPSQTTGRRSEFPPRADLPGSVVVESVPGLGTTWYDRGARYWLRRALVFLAFALVVTLMSLLVGGFLIGIKESSPTGFTGALIAEILWSLSTAAFLLVRTAQRWNVPEKARPLTPGQRRAASAGGALGVLANAGWVVGQIILVLAALAGFGLYLTLLIYALLPEYPPEHKARIRLAEQLSHRPAPA